MSYKVISPLFAGFLAVLNLMSELQVDQVISFCSKQVWASPSSKIPIHIYVKHIKSNSANIHHETDTESYLFQAAPVLLHCRFLQCTLEAVSHLITWEEMFFSVPAGY